MKTAAEWRSEIVDYECSHFDGSYDKLILAIQLDAMKEGMRRAAGISSLDTQLPRETDPGEKKTRYAVAQNILTAADQLTEKDL